MQRSIAHKCCAARLGPPSAQMGASRRAAASAAVRARRSARCSASLNGDRPAWGMTQELGARTENAVQTPHSGYHDDGSARRFFEGWYFRVTLPEDCDNESFALIYSVEDPHRASAQRGVGAQVMGARDGYFVRHDPKVDSFWAWRSQLALGNVFRPRRAGRSPPVVGMLSEDEFSERVEEGFQASATWHQGALLAAGATAGPGPPSAVPSVRWAFAVEPVYGWGGAAGGKQRPTAGWMAALPVFEPHWQIVMSHGLATGWIEWGDRRYDFKQAPFYSEKNWGGQFPKKWFWAQCNAFENEPDLALTAGGGVRSLPLSDGSEQVALIGVHHKGKFIEIVPWAGEISWEVDPWGSWRFRGSSAEGYEAEVVATCAAGAGTPLRAPTADAGLASICRDTFFGELQLTVWEKGPGGARQVLVSARSGQAALEVGGGPWFSTWVGSAEMREPFRSLVRLPLDPSALAAIAPDFLRPPGL